MIMPCMGMMVSMVWAFVLWYLIRQRTRVKLRELEVRELELGGRQPESE